MSIVLDNMERAEKAAAAAAAVAAAAASHKVRRRLDHRRHTFLLGLF